MGSLIRTLSSKAPVMEQITFLDVAVFRGIKLRSPAVPHSWTEYPTNITDASEIIHRLQTPKPATICITNRCPITREVLRANPQLKMISLAATGYDRIDIEACKEHGVVVSNVRDWAVSIPEHIWSLILSLRRQVPAYTRAMERGEWKKTPVEDQRFVLEPMPRTLHGSMLGIVGYGALAKHVERIALAFGMRVCIAERKGQTSVRRGRTSFEDCLASSDVVVVLVPLNAETRDLISEHELRLMKSSALLINCARGGIVDEHALADAIERGRIAGTGADVLSVEPPTEGNPLLNLIERGFDNVVVTPHMAWMSEESYQELARQVIENVDRFSVGDPVRVVTNQNP